MTSTECLRRKNRINRMQAGKECNVLEHRCNLTNYVPQKKGVPFGDIAGLQIPEASVIQHLSAQAQGEGMLLRALAKAIQQGNPTHASRQ